MKTGRKWTLGAALLASAATPAAALPAPPPGWIEYQDEQAYSHCGVAQRDRAGIPSLGLALVEDGTIQLSIIDVATDVVRKQNVALTMRFDDGAALGVGGIGIQPSAFRKGFSVDIDQTMLAAIARARRLSVLRGDKEVARIDLAGSSAAITRMRECFGRLSARRAALPAPPAPPAPPPLPRKGPSGAVSIRSYVHPDDYPVLALRNGAEGDVRLELEVDEQGHVDKCAVLSSSGDVELDYGSCLVAERRFHFLPALDAGARPVRGKVTRTLRWRLEDDPPSADPPSGP